MGRGVTCSGMKWAGDCVYSVQSDLVVHTGSGCWSVCDDFEGFRKVTGPASLSTFTGKPLLVRAACSDLVGADACVSSLGQEGRPRYESISMCLSVA